jgi:hypothetical protein
MKAQLITPKPVETFFDLEFIIGGLDQFSESHTGEVTVVTSRHKGMNFLSVIIMDRFTEQMEYKAYLFPDDATLYKTMDEVYTGFLNSSDVDDPGMLVWNTLTVVLKDYCMADETISI